jgi:hypothetical protein
MSKELDAITERVVWTLYSSPTSHERVHPSLVIRAALDEAVTEPHALLREIAEDALNDGPINRGLNSVQAVLDYVAAIDALSAAEPSKPPSVASLIEKHGLEITPSYDEIDRMTGKRLAPEPDPALPLGHEYEHFGDEYDSCAITYCGQPESAHQPMQDKREGERG